MRLMLKTEAELLDGEVIHVTGGPTRRASEAR
jgi:hypothetical protein